MKSLIQRWLKEKDAVAATEAALIFPVLLTLLLGTFDMGYGILASQKTIRAAQVTADLIARTRSADDATIDSAIEGGMLAMQPFNTESYGVDITSVEFDEDEEVLVLWCETRNMDAPENISESVASLAAPGEGVVVVTVRYEFEPAFSGFLFNTIAMKETSFSRGRLTSTVTREGDGGSC